MFCKTCNNTRFVPPWSEDDEAVTIDTPDPTPCPDCNMNCTTCNDTKRVPWADDDYVTGKGNENLADDKPCPDCCGFDVHNYTANSILLDATSETIDLHQIVLDRRFSELKETKQKRRARGGGTRKPVETEHRVGYVMYFDGLQFMAADLVSIRRSVGAYMMRVDAVLGVEDDALF